MLSVAFWETSHECQSTFMFSHAFRPTNSRTNGRIIQIICNTFLTKPTTHQARASILFVDLRKFLGVKKPSTSTTTTKIFEFPSTNSKMFILAGFQLEWNAIMDLENECIRYTCTIEILTLESLPFSTLVTAFCTSIHAVLEGCFLFMAILRMIAFSTGMSTRTMSPTILFL